MSKPTGASANKTSTATASIAKSSPVTTTAASSSANVDQLRAELTQVTSLLKETDEALDEWMAECDRLQGIVQMKEKENVLIAKTVDDLRQHILSMEDAAGSAKGKAPAIDALKAQLEQAQEWVKQEQAKAAEAEARAQKERERADLGQASINEATRLAAVVSAHEQELTKLRSRVQGEIDELNEKRALVGKLQFLSAALSFQLQEAQKENEGVTQWLKSVLRWASRV